MALITCPDCGKTISDKAEFCVNCGCPMNYIKSQCDVYLFCLVEFIDNIHSKEYYYISDDENASVGNFAIVEISGSNEEKIVKIIKTVLCTRETEAPYPIPSTKHLKRILYGREIETVILKYMDVYVKLFKDKRCTNSNISCKLFMCEYVEKNIMKKKSLPKNYLLLDFFFNKKQKEILKRSYRKKKEDTISKLLVNR